MQLDLFAGIPVRDYEEGLAWYKRFLGSEPSFVPRATEAVWELAGDHRPGIDPAQRETYSNGVR